jgi:hypothetical protein
MTPTSISVMITLMMAPIMPVTPVAQAISRVPDFEIMQDHFQLNDDYGGDIAAYARAFELLASGGEEIRVTGQCYSACTMVLKNPNACAMPKAIFGFHAARYYNKKTLEIIGESVMGNFIVWMHYPDKVKQRLGGRLTAEPVYIKGTDLLPPCK